MKRKKRRTEDFEKLTKSGCVHAVHAEGEALVVTGCLQLAINTLASSWLRQQKRKN